MLHSAYSQDTPASNGNDSYTTSQFKTPLDSLRFKRIKKGEIKERGQKQNHVRFLSVCEKVQGPKIKNLVNSKATELFLNHIFVPLLGVS